MAGAIEDKLTSPIVPLATASDSTDNALAVHQYGPHPIANLFPQMQTPQMAALTNIIKTEGLVDDIVLFEGKVLDGRARYLACLESGVTPRFREFDPTVEGNPIEFVVKKNLDRRQLKDPQLALIAARMAGAKLGDNQYHKQGTTIVAASRRVGIHPKMVERAKRILEKSSIAADAVANLRITLGVAGKLADLSPAQQELILASQASSSALRKTIHRAFCEMQIANPVPVPEGRFPVIVSDPPWDVDRVPYATMTVEEIAHFHQILLAEKSADDCRLFLWTTMEFLPSTYKMIGEWEWKYEATMVWHKTGGHQHPNRPQYNLEFVVVASRGSPQYADIRDFLACFNAHRRDHSRKPDEFYEMIVRVTPGPRLELFARRAHDGFEPHGDEIDWSTPTEYHPAITVSSAPSDLHEFLHSSTDHPHFDRWLAEDIATAGYMTKGMASA